MTTKRKRKWTNEQLVLAVKNNQSIHGVLRELGLKTCGGSHALVKLRIKELGLDTSHMTGRGWCKGNKHRDHVTKNVEYPLEEILVENSTYQSTGNLKRRLLRAGLLQNNCYVCGCDPIWNNKPLTLQLDHIDGNRCNHRLGNLRLLCPNCHSQTDTFCSKRAG
jgi:hypothetical protein